MDSAVGVPGIPAGTSGGRATRRQNKVAAVVHAAHNCFFQLGVPALLRTAPGSRAALWDLAVGDTGLAVAVLYAAAYLLLRGANGSRTKTAGAG